jgi:hypothetical protein
MYYRNAHCAVVVYDITQTVWHPECIECPLGYPLMLLFERLPWTKPAPGFVSYNARPIHRLSSYFAVTKLTLRHGGTFSWLY